MAPDTRMRVTSGDTTYDLLSPAPTAEYRSISRQTDQYPEVKVLVVDRNAAWVCWEAMFDPFERRLFSRRTQSEKLPAPNLMNWDKSVFHTLTMNHAGADLGGSAFGKSGHWRYSTDPDRINISPEPGTVQILHVVSDVVDTTGGARLSFQSEREDQRGRVIRADEMTRLLPDIRLYVLQLPVGLNDGKRDGVCREKAALLRAFAAQLQLASEQVVITLPGLRFREGQLLLQAIVAGVEQPQPTPAKSIFEELKKARAHLFETLPPDEAEAGFDICYYGSI